VRFVSVPPTRSSEIVREMMLLAGEAAGALGARTQNSLTFSSQEAPSSRRTFRAPKKVPFPYRSSTSGEKE